MDTARPPDAVREKPGVHSAARGDFTQSTVVFPASRKEFAAEMGTVHGVLPIDATHTCRPGIAVRGVSRETGRSVPRRMVSSPVPVSVYRWRV